MGRDGLGTAAQVADLEADVDRFDRRANLADVDHVGIDDDLDRRARRHELVELGDDSRTERAPPGDDDPSFDVRFVALVNLLDAPRCRLWRGDEQRVVLGDADELLPLRERTIGRRVELDLTVSIQDPDQRARLERELARRVRRARELVEGRKVELVAVEVEQLTEHDAQAALPARLRGQLGHDVVGAHDDEPIAGQ